MGAPRLPSGRNPQASAVCQQSMEIPEHGARNRAKRRPWLGRFFVLSRLGENSVPFAYCGAVATAVD